jgi:hypothetical protein
MADLASSFAWLDYSEAERRRMNEVIGLFRDQGILDELGLGSVRDAFADLFYPGTSTIQTRARYFLLIPWIYLRMEKERIPSSQIAERARANQNQTRLRLGARRREIWSDRAARAWLLRVVDGARVDPGRSALPAPDRSRSGPLLCRHLAE